MSGIVVIDGTVKENFRLAEGLKQTLKSDPISANCLFVTNGDEALRAIDDVAPIWSIVKVRDDFAHVASAMKEKNISTIAIAKRDIAAQVQADHIFEIPFHLDRVVPVISSIMDARGQAYNIDYSSKTYEFGGFTAKFDYEGRVHSLSYTAIHPGNKSSPDDRMQNRLMGPQRELLAALVKRAAMEAERSNVDCGSLATMFSHIARVTPELQTCDASRYQDMTTTFGSLLGTRLNAITYGRIGIIPHYDPTTKKPVDFKLTDRGAEAAPTLSLKEQMRLQGLKVA
ncbi:MAG TPA: hypothetical protein VIN59_04045 [Alphaproteobacteria bacterium]